MTLEYNEFLELADDILNLGMTIRQNQLNGYGTDKTGKEQLREFLLEKYPKNRPTVVIVGAGTGDSVERALPMTKLNELGANVVVVNDDAHGTLGSLSKERLHHNIPIEELLKPHSDAHYYDADNEINDSVDPSTRKGRSKKRRR